MNRIYDKALKSLDDGIDISDIPVAIQVVLETVEFVSKNRHLTSEQKNKIGLDLLLHIVDNSDLEDKQLLRSSIELLAPSIFKVAVMASKHLIDINQKIKKTGCFGKH